MKIPTTLDELEQARRALLHADLPMHEKASQAEKLGDYRTARELWRQVANSHKGKDEAQLLYAHKRHKFCVSAVTHSYTRPEFKHLHTQIVQQRINHQEGASNVQ